MTDAPPPKGTGKERKGRKQPEVPAHWKLLFKLWKKHQAEQIKAGKRATLKLGGTFRVFLNEQKKLPLDDKKVLAEFENWYNRRYKPSLTKATKV